MWLAIFYMLVTSRKSKIMCTKRMLSLKESRIAMIKVFKESLVHVQVHWGDFLYCHPMRTVKLIDCIAEQMNFHTRSFSTSSTKICAAGFFTCKAFFMSWL